MGFTSNWLLFRGSTPEAVYHALNVQPSGIRTDWPQEPLAAAMFTDGSLLVVESSSEESPEGTWDLAMLSGDCEVIAAGEIDGAGHSEVAVWRYGRKVWSVTSPYEEDSPTLVGDVPADVVAGLQYVRTQAMADEDWDPDDTIDYFNPILNLAEHLTGYVCGNGAQSSGLEHFEILESTGEAHIAATFPAALTEALATRGFRLEYPAEDRKKSYIVDVYAADGPLTGLTAAVEITLKRGRYGGVVVGGGVSIRSAAAAELNAGLPEEALADGWESADRGQIETSPFDRSPHPAYWDTFCMREADDIERGVQWVLKYLDGPMAVWFAERDSVGKLAVHAKQPHWISKRFHPVKFRATVAFFAAHGHFKQAAELVGWYLERDGYDSDSFERATAFDAAMRERFPEYAAERRD
ncbi:hypothetical protein AB0N05_11270 [Nocardia sp. NPDC051030]|uniref:hypothetical protein n=1 Tax=Nocardia sp. NPDC051030 TaxID=3155162 RepID=UPI00342FB161